VVITRGQIARDKPALVKAMAEACRAGWRGYLDDPSAANGAMEKLNTDMDAATFADAAAAQKPLIDTPAGVGSMTLDRWQSLRQQLIDLKILGADAAPAEGCFVNP
jgi:NitT/TauT family transport system substrate-binding protein